MGSHYVSFVSFGYCIDFLLSVTLVASFVSHVFTRIDMCKQKATILQVIQQINQTEIVLKTLNPVYAVVMRHPGI